MLTDISKGTLQGFTYYWLPTRKDKEKAPRLWRGNLWLYFCVYPAVVSHPLLSSVPSSHYGPSQNYRAKLDFGAWFSFEIFLKDTISTITANPIEAIISGDDQLTVQFLSEHLARKCVNGGGGAGLG